MRHFAPWKRAAEAILPFAYIGVLAWIAIYICREAFFTESRGHLASMHGEWIALARLAGADWLAPRWWPYWGAGAPIQYGYAPLVPFSMGLAGRLFALPPAAALHMLTGLVFCMAPLALYLGVWRITRAPEYSFAAALIWLLGPFPELIEPARAWGLAWFVSTRRTYRLFAWDDLPHQTSLALLPIAAWLLSRALKSRRPLDYLFAGAALSLTMAPNIFGMALAALLAVTVALSLEPRFRPDLLLRSALTAAAAYIVVSPWITPRLLATVAADARIDHEADYSWRGGVALVLVLLVSAAAWRLASRFIRPWPLRWMVLFACPVTLIPALDRFLRVHFAPQPYRYMVEMEMAVVLLAVFALKPVVARIPVRARFLLALPLLYLGGRAVVANRIEFKRTARQPDFAQSIEYRAARWLQTNLPGQRVLMAGSPGLWIDAFCDSPQVAGQVYNTAANWNQQVALESVYNSGVNYNEGSILWMKAFGARALGVPGPRSPAFWKPEALAAKFEGVLPVLWREDDTAIYRVPWKSQSLAHVIRPDQAPQPARLYETSVDSLRRYVEAIDDPAADASLAWRGPNHMDIRARAGQGQAVSVQITYDPGWRASVNGSPRSIRPDGLGLMLIDPRCVGPCEIRLDYTGGTEALATRIGSASVMLLACAWVLMGTRRGRRPAG